ncbi:alpha/beta hydrolase [Streptomyces sp. TRM S81-3]|uniref:Alpha/beta hydrolase n=1 Tax=Streptomyces griseicoloratus TaxID=2752516 RepID=A0A926L8Q9_9ACTN|nr:alpha/beta hydrolase [Streptomyces griseicoloratus]MBD0424710.1 alpha/beta hydrolase [Streptomyces griseicoloratus]
MRSDTRATLVALLCCGVLAACTSAPDAARAPDSARTSATAKPSTGGSSAQDRAAPRTTRPTPRPPASYTPSWPHDTVRNSAGYAVNDCVPSALRDEVTSLTTSDGVHLSALELGDGPDGVLLAHEQGYSICSFLGIGKELAARGYHVMIPEYRNHGASEEVPDNEHLARDARAALAELERLGAERVFLGGASCGGTTAAIAGAEGRLPVVGLLIMSSPARCGGDGVAAVKTIDAPSLFVVSPGDMNGAVEKQVRELYAASASKDKELVIDPSGFHGTDMIRRSPQGAALHDRAIRLVESAYARRG